MESSLKSEELASAAAGKEDALSSAAAEMTSLKEENSAKLWVYADVYSFLLKFATLSDMCLIFYSRSQIMTMEIQISALKEDLEKEHQRWRAAQSNYERHVSAVSSIPRRLFCSQ